MLRIGNPVLGIVFGRIGDRAAGGLRTALDGPPPEMDVANVVDAVLEAPIAPSFTRIGYEARRRLFHWRAIDSYGLDGRVVADHWCHVGPRTRPRQSSWRVMARR